MEPFVDEGRCNHCALAVPSYRTVQTGDDYGCHWDREITITCSIPGPPPTESSCTFYELLECQNNCTDGDGDNHYAYDPQLCPQGDDCDDTDPTRHPGIVEDCHDTARKDEDCDQRANCEDQQCWAGQTAECDEQCDQDNDGFYKETCGGDDCRDDESLAFPGYGTPPNGFSGEASGSVSCDDEIDNDCDDLTDCHDPDCGACPSPTPTPPPPSGVVGGCLGPPFPNGTCSSGFINQGGVCTRSQAFMNQCNRFGGYEDWSCSCSGGCEGGGCSPIVVDVLGNGFDLTNLANGVNFDLDNDGSLERISWTSTNSDDAWLALDRNNDGFIDKGRELFGNVTPQLPPPDGQEMQGFHALAMYDGVGYGGNGDGRITRHDTIFDRLRLWQDTNHNGISEASELFTLPELGLRRIDLDYRQSNRVDAHGNRFKYRARVRDASDAHLGRWAWDVFLVVQQ